MGPRQVLMTRIVWATVVPQKSRQSEAKLASATKKKS